MVDLVTGMAVLTQAVGIAKDLRQIDKGLSDAEYKAKMAELYEALAEVKMSLADAQLAMRERDEEIKRLKAATSLKVSTVEKDGFRFLTFEDGTPKGDPFCPRCEQVDARFFHIAQLTGARNRCPVCNSEYGSVPRYIWDRIS